MLLYACAGINLLAIAIFWRDPVALAVCPIVAAVLALAGAAIQQLTVEDEGDRLSVYFGPLPLFRRRVRYDQIESVELGRTTILDGFGIHLGIRGGWVWNVWGFDCVVLRLRRGRWLIGSDDARNLAAFLQERVASHTT